MNDLSATLFGRLIDDAAMFPPGNAGVEDAVSAHRSYRGSWFAPIIGPLVVRDDRLAEVGREALRQAQGTDTTRAQGTVTPAEPVDARTEGAGVLAVSVVNTSGAGGIVSLARRNHAGISVVGVETALRDLDDLAGNAARVCSAAAELDVSVRVFVEFPFAPGWERSVETVEAAGLFGKLRTGGVEAAMYPSAEQLARQLSVLVEADLPFKTTAGLHRAWPNDGPFDKLREREGGLRGREGGTTERVQHGFLNILMAVDALVDGASQSEAAELLRHPRNDALAATVAGWDQPRARRVRRRFLSFGCCGVRDPVDDLRALGLVEEIR